MNLTNKDKQKVLDSQMSTQVIYSIAAVKILEELDARGFTADDPSNADGLRDKITDIIQQTLSGNTNYCVTPASEDNPEYGNTYYPELKRATREEKLRLIRGIEINEDADLQNQA